MTGPLPDDVALLRLALEQIASGNTPCQECGKVHIERVVTDPKGPRWTWAAIDGHAYRKMDTRTVAANALDDTAYSDGSRASG